MHLVTWSFRAIFVFNTINSETGTSSRRVCQSQLMRIFHWWLKWLYSEMQIFKWLPLPAANENIYRLRQSLAAHVELHLLNPNGVLVITVIQPVKTSERPILLATYKRNQQNFCQKISLIFHVTKPNTFLKTWLLSGEKLFAKSRNDGTDTSSSIYVPVGSFYTKKHKNVKSSSNFIILASF